MAKLKAIIKRVDRKDAYTAAVSDSLENLQKFVGGYIEAVTIYRETEDRPGVVIICNEEGVIQGLPFNCRIGGLPIFGDFLILGTKGPEFCDVPIAPKLINKIIEESKLI